MSDRAPLAAGPRGVASSGPQEKDRRATDARGAAPCADDAMTRPVDAPPPPKRDPWTTIQSRAAGLPRLGPGEADDPAAVARVREAWVKAVLRATLDPESTSHVKTAEALKRAGHRILSPHPEKVVRQWYGYLALELRRGRLKPDVVADPELRAIVANLTRLPERAPGRRDAPKQGPGGRFAGAVTLAVEAL